VGTVGTLIPNIEARIVNPQTGKLMFPGERGELWIRGPYVMKGNYNLYQLITVNLLHIKGYIYHLTLMNMY